MIAFIAYSFWLSDINHYTESDRKANMDVLESTKVANKEEIRRLRDGNKEFRQKLVALQKVYRLISYLLYSYEEFQSYSHNANLDWWFF